MESGKIIITIEDYRKKHNVSKYKIIKNCGLSATQLNNYCNNKISRVDLPVMARICDYLGCNLSDLLQYIPAEDICENEIDIKKKGKKEKRGI